MPEGNIHLDAEPPVQENDAMKLVSKHIAQRLRARRTERRMTLQQVADACGMPFRQVSKMELGTNRMFASQLPALAKALGTTESYFFEGLPPLAGMRRPLAREAGEFLATYGALGEARQERLRALLMVLRIED